MKYNIRKTIIAIVALLYVIGLYGVVHYDITASTREYTQFYIILAYFGLFLLLMIHLWNERKKDFGGPDEETNQGDGPTWFMYMLKCLGITGLVVLSAAMLYGLLSIPGNFPKLLSGISVAINILIVIGILAAIIKFVRPNKMTYVLEEKSVTGLITHIIFYLPCIFIDVVEWFKREYRITTRTDLIILAIDAVLILFVFYWDKIYKLLFVPKGKMLLNNPIYLNNETILGTYENLNTQYSKTNSSKNYADISSDTAVDSSEDESDGENKEQFIYNYAISSWIYINYHGANMNSSYSKYTTLLNYGNKPTIEYNGLLNKIRVRMAQGQDGLLDIYETDELKMNKWNHFLINYTGGTLDIFINGELVASEPGVVPYMEYDSVISGETPGIHGGMCNVQYFNKALNRSSIESLYSSFKDKTPPII